MNFKPQGITVRKRKYGLFFVIGRVVQRQYLFRYGCRGMNASTFVFLRLIRIYRLPSAFIPMWWGCNNCISTYANPVRQENMKAPSRQLQPVVIHRGGKYLLELIAADVSCALPPVWFHIPTPHRDSLGLSPYRLQIQQAVQTIADNGWSEMPRSS